MFLHDLATIECVFDVGEISTVAELHNNTKGVPVAGHERIAVAANVGMVEPAGLPRGGGGRGRVWGIKGGIGGDFRS